MRASARVKSRGQGRSIGVGSAVQTPRTRSRKRIIVGFVAVAAAALGTQGFTASAAGSFNAGALGATNTQAGYLHPAHPYNAPQTTATQGITCGLSNGRCLDLEVYSSENAYGHYVGHDEPSNEFLSSLPGSGNQYRVEMQLPKDPPTQPTRANGVNWTFMQSVAPWFGMALCNDESYPEHNTTIGACQPDSDSNIADNANPAASDYIGNHVGAAYMEFQFYPPGWAPQFPNETTGGVSCDATLWCAAMVIWSFQSDPSGTNNNSDCVNNSNGGVEFGNDAYLTHTGASPIAAQPYKNPGAFDPNSNFDVYFHSGDYLVITMHDIPDSSPGPNGSGLEIDVTDLTSGESGSMVASGTGPHNNGFGTLKWDPSASSCTVIPYNFHPMYSTSGLYTRVPWAAHTYNVAMTDEIGHFDYCDGSGPNHSGVTSVNNPAGGCGGNEGPPSNSEPAETPPSNNQGFDDSVCYDGTLGQSTTLVNLPGCLGGNLPGFDGSSYQSPSSTGTGNVSSSWPDGNFALRPTPIRFTSPLTGPNYDQNYSDQAFENDLPALEFVSGQAQLGGTNSTCSIATGAGCTAQPPTDDTANTTPAADFGFYPFFSIDTHVTGQCWWMLGQDITLQPGNTTYQTTNDFDGGVADTQYGQSGVAAVPYNVPFLQGVVQGEPPIVAPLTEDFHTFVPTNTDAFGPWAQTNPCTAAAITLPANTPELPVVPGALLGGAAVALVAGRRLGRRGRTEKKAA